MAATASAATANLRATRNAQVAPAPGRLTDNSSEMTDEQAEALRRANEEANDMAPPERTHGLYEERKGKIGKITRKKWYIVDPRSSRLVQYWDAVGMTALIFTAVVTCVEVSFVDSPGCIDGLFIINRFVDSIFSLDMCLQFFLMFPQTPKSATDTIRWVHDQDQIALHYLRTWFSIDFLSIMVSGFDFVALDWWQVCGPATDALAAAELLEPAGGDDISTLKVLRVVRVARLVKLVRLVRSSRIMKRFESRTAINYGHLALFKCLVGLLLAAHWFACLWGLITTFEDGKYEKSWYVVFGYCRFTPRDGGVIEGMLAADPTNSTLQDALGRQQGSDLHYSCDPAQDKYIAALYWAIMTITSIGYGDIRAPDGNTWEQSWCAVLMLFGGMIWGSVIAIFCGVIANLDPAGTEFRQTMDNLNRFMELQGLDHPMRQQLREYFHQTRHLLIARANKLLIESMSPMLQGLVVWKVNERWLRHVWFLRSAEDSFMVQLSLSLVAAVFAPSELCPHGYMYIVHRGIALYGGKVLTSGKVWGEDIILNSVHLRSKFAARCMTYVEVYMIARDELVNLAVKFPATLKLIRRSAFRLGFRREMIRRAQDSIKKSNEERGIKNKESQSEKLLVAVSSRKLDEEQAKMEKAGRAQIDKAFDSKSAPDAAVGSSKSAPVGAELAAFSSANEDVSEAVSALIADKIAESETRLMAKLDAIATQLAAALPAAS